MKYDFELVLEEENGLSKILRQVDRSAFVLEFGPAAGRATKYLKERLGCKVYIVEIDAESAKSASEFAEDTIIGDIEQYEWLDKWEDMKFDYILFADVLEHLRDPQKVLAKTKMLLKESGKTLISVPNVAHNSILINLFNNVFNYTPVGLLDNTHIHLFAYNTLKLCCDQAGYTPIIEDAVYVDVGENEVAAAYNQVSKEVQAELKKRIFNNVYQFVFSLQKKEYVKRQGQIIDKRIIPYTRDYKFQMFFDRGNGWMEENCVIQPINIKGLIKIIVELSNAQEIRNIRVDPLDCGCGICIESIRLLNGDRIEIETGGEFLSSNAEYREGNEFLFLTEDPNIYFHGVDWTAVSEIEISYYVMNKGDMALRLLKSKCDEIEYNEKTVFELKNHLETMEEEKNELEKELEQSKEELDHRIDFMNELKEENSVFKEELEHYINVINELKEGNCVLENELKCCKEELELNKQTNTKIRRHKFF